jgi:hypothetical protein
MAKPRVFVSSTYYDLKHIRSSLDIFIESLGFEAILSEKGDIAFSPEAPLDESCYREAATSDIFVLIVGGRYGSGASGQDKKPGKSFYERYESITKKEYDSAVRKDIPTYILIESSVHAEYFTYLRNKENDATNYAHVDSVNIFRFVEEILARPRNNPVHTFDRFADIESWLRDQWAGLFRELLTRASNQKQIATLTGQVEDLQEVNNTLKRYLEALMSGVSKEDSTKLIRDEEKRLEEREQREKIRQNGWTEYITRVYDITLDDVIRLISEADSFADFADRAAAHGKNPKFARVIKRILVKYDTARADFNNLRRILGLRAFRRVPDIQDDDAADEPDL